MFKKVHGYNNYEVSDMGEVRNIITGKYLRLSLYGNYGHLSVCLSRNGKMKTHKVHRLVLESFIGKCPKGMQCCHNNGVPSDNRLENLRWDTPSSNVRDSIRHGTFRGINSLGYISVTESQIKDIINKYKYKSKDNNIITLSKEYNVSTTTIYRIVNNL